MKKYKPIYKCKLCGKTFSTIGTETYLEQLAPTSKHECQSDGAIGILELVGYREIIEEDYPVSDFIGF